MKIQGSFSAEGKGRVGRTSSPLIVLFGAEGFSYGQPIYSDAKVKSMQQGSGSESNDLRAGDSDSRKSGMEIELLAALFSLKGKRLWMRVLLTHEIRQPF